MWERCALGQQRTRTTSASTPIESAPASQSTGAAAPTAAAPGWPSGPPCSPALRCTACSVCGGCSRCHLEGRLDSVTGGGGSTSGAGACDWRNAGLRSSAVCASVKRLLGSLRAGVARVHRQPSCACCAAQEPARATVKAAGCIAAAARQTAGGGVPTNTRRLREAASGLSAVTAA